MTTARTRALRKVQWRAQWAQKTWVRGIQQAQHQLEVRLSWGISESFCLDHWPQTKLHWPWKPETASQGGRQARRNKFSRVFLVVTLFYFRKTDESYTFNRPGMKGNSLLIIHYFKSISSFVYACYANSEKAMASHSSTLAWKIPWTEEPGRLQSIGSLRVGHDWATSLSLFTFMHWRRKWQPTPVFLPGESQGQGNLVGWHLWGRTESDTTEVT